MLGSHFSVSHFQYLLRNSSEQHLVTGPISSVHQWVDMTDRVAKENDGEVSRTCQPALGYSFAAGTTDGPGEFDFKQVKGTSLGSTVLFIYWL